MDDLDADERELMLHALFAYRRLVSAAALRDDAVADAGASMAALERIERLVGRLDGDVAAENFGA